MLNKELFLKASKIIFSNPLNKSETKYKKIAGRKIKLNNHDYIQFEMILDKKIYHENITIEKIFDYFDDTIKAYKQADLYFDDGTHYMAFNKNNTVSYHKAKDKDKNSSANIDTPRSHSSHNKEKNYIINEGENIPILVELGIFTKEFKVINSMYHKFKQINRFIELFDDVISKKYADYDNNSAINIIDFGCGKSYLTFIMYYYLTAVKMLNVNMIGIDLKQDVIEKCNKLKDKYNCKNLSFAVGDINGYKPPFMPDVVISLHGCDLATDYALYNALKWQASVIFVAPCCEHEINAQIDIAPMHNILKYGIVKERFSALLTNSIRCNILELHDYKTELIEFVDIAHSPKNLLIRAVKSSHIKSYKDSVRQELDETLRKFNISQTLHDLIFSIK